ncbi:hypothetical protein VNO80_20609 [Phaseolus coccineus]|uniref:Uncharacterized protein n=1 Tax=Phaseolus coccineus TaxID=3886 RepID=A0AAN9M0V7_PHACN
MHKVGWVYKLEWRYFKDGVQNEEANVTTCVVLGQEVVKIKKWAWVGKVGCTVTRWMNQRHVSNPFPLTLSILMHKTHLSLSSLRFALTNLHRSVTSICNRLVGVE